MVKGVEDETYNKLKMRFNFLVSRTDTINQLLDIWESDGIEKAIDMYYTDIGNNYGKG